MRALRLLSELNVVHRSAQVHLMSAIRCLVRIGAVYVCTSSYTHASEHVQNEG